MKLFKIHVSETVFYPDLLKGLQWSMVLTVEECKLLRHPLPVAISNMLTLSLASQQLYLL